MIKYKMKFENLEKRDTALNLFHKLGYHSYEDGISKNQLCVLTHENGVVRTTENLSFCETFLPINFEQLNDLVVLQRNDVNDANYSITVASDKPDTPVFKTFTGEFFTYSTNNNKWVECKSIDDKTTSLKALAVRQKTTTTIKVEGLKDLIDGKAALIALANGEEVEFKHDAHGWVTCLGLNIEQVIHGMFQLRIKPRLISINGIKVPAPIEPQHYQDVWVISGLQENGYTKTINKDGDDYPLGCWATEHQIKKVVAALHNAFEVPA